MARGLHAGTWRLGLATLALLGCSSCIYIEVDSSMARCEREVLLSAPLEPGSTFSADTDDGSITIEGTEANECSLQATIVASAATMERAEELAGQIGVRLAPAGKGLRVVIDRPPVIRNAWFDVSLRGSLPTQTSLILSTSDGSIHVAKITGAIEARTSDGGIEARDIDGDMKLRTSDGAITLSDVTTGSLAAETSDGAITLENVCADTANVRTNDGSIRWRNAVAGRAECHSGDGAIQMEYAPAAAKAVNLIARTSDGGITLVTPPELSAAIDAGTNDGSIHTDLPITIRGKIGKSLNGTIGGGEGRIHLRTGDGSITIR